ncbi:inner membrane CreD family protein, partial [Campylobacter coli]
QKTTVKAHPVRKDLIGTDLHNAKDENGIFYVRELYQRALDKGDIGFDFAYLFSSLAIIIPLSLYTLSIMGQKRFAIVMATILFIL